MRDTETTLTAGVTIEARVVTDGERIEARVLETEVNLNWVWLRVDDGTAEGRWVRSDVVESFTVLHDEDELLGPTIHHDPRSWFWR